MSQKLHNFLTIYSAAGVKRVMVVGCFIKKGKFRCAGNSQSVSAFAATAVDLSGSCRESLAGVLCRLFYKDAAVVCLRFQPV